MLHVITFVMSHTNQNQKYLSILFHFILILNLTFKIGKTILFLMSVCTWRLSHKSFDNSIIALNIT